LENHKLTLEKLKREEFEISLDKLSFKISTYPESLLGANELKLWLCDTI